MSICHDSFLRNLGLYGTKCNSADFFRLTVRYIVVMVIWAILGIFGKFVHFSRNGPRCFSLTWLVVEATC